VTDVPRPPEVGSAKEMRRQFDAVFAAPPLRREADVESFLGLRIDGDAFALRIRSMSGLAAARKIVPLPGAAPAMLGLAGIRGLVVPVFGLSALMGHGSEAPRWLALCADERGDTIALGFRDLDGYIDALVSEVRAVDPGEPGPARRASFVRELVRDRGELRGVIDLSAMVKAAYETVPRQDRVKER
jgi:chemotaxis signal transduction protein